MQTSKLTTRFSALALAIATSACAPHAARAQDAQPTVEARPAAPAQAAAPAPPAEPATRPKEVRDRPEEMRLRVVDQQRALADQQRRNAEQQARIAENMAKMQADIAKASSDFGKPGVMKFAWSGSRWSSPDAPVIISTQPMDATAAAEWKEDLQVMDKILRDEIGRAGGDDPHAMGIKLTLVGRPGPTYVEGGGVVFSAAVNFPLAPVGAASGKKDEKPRDPASKWEQAKRELSGYPAPARIRVDGDETTTPMVFDQAKLDQLNAAVARLLLEAANIRHLKENEAVFVSVVGMDDGGAPVRLTYKAAKADIDAAAGGKVTPEEFAKRIVQRIG